MQSVRRARREGSLWHASEFTEVIAAILSLPNIKASGFGDNSDFVIIYFADDRRQGWVVHEVVYELQLIYKILTIALAHDPASVPNWRIASFSLLWLSKG
jgi:hypothetical protein